MTTDHRPLVLVISGAGYDIHGLRTVVCRRLQNKGADLIELAVTRPDTSLSDGQRMFDRGLLQRMPFPTEGRVSEESQKRLRDRLPCRVSEIVWLFDLARALEPRGSGRRGLLGLMEQTRVCEDVLENALIRTTDQHTQPHLVIVRQATSFASAPAHPDQAWRQMVAGYGEMMESYMTHCFLNQVDGIRRSSVIIDPKRALHVETSPPSLPETFLADVVKEVDSLLRRARS